MTVPLEACREVLDALRIVPNPSLRDLDKAKVKVAREHGLSTLPTNAAILRAAQPYVSKELKTLLTRKKIRSLSGVNVVAVMTPPDNCPHGRCHYCPGGPEGGTPQSYTGHEPAAMRGRQNDYDPYRQVMSRIKQLREIGHDVDKIELIIMGGTFPSTPIPSQEVFVKGCLDALNGIQAFNLQEAQKMAETSPIRNVGITVETRPDWAGETEITRMLNYGVTKMELGVQILNDDIYTKINRGHTVADVIEATRRIKDSGLKLCYHLMPGLPGSDFQRDLDSFNQVFTDERFKPDMLKIYPCLVMEGTELHRWWSLGEYKPYAVDEAVRLLVEVKKRIPPWIRIMRVQRDIPSNLIVAGVKNSNLRQLVLHELTQQGFQCRCIRCREIGQRLICASLMNGEEKVEVKINRHSASGGEEVFISVEESNLDALIGYLRLRIPSPHAFLPETKGGDIALIRELHIYGTMVPVGGRDDSAWQHKGYGALLLREAERIAREEYDCNNILVTSALGTKQYYRRFNYQPLGRYMSKQLGGT